jgi:C4-dicarboxylate-specific signal transduction histidine kinase
VRTTRSENSDLQLSVENSWRGIAEISVARVSEPFFTTNWEGLAMGLSISLSIAQPRGGRLGAENGAEGGGIFRCVLPMAQQAESAETQ